MFVFRESITLERLEILLCVILSKDFMTAFNQIVITVLRDTNLEIKFLKMTI